jgi:Ser/Thr protein kinase RdoA (MazF antagonist)
MPTLDPDLLRWAVRAAAPGAEVAEVRGLRDGGSPWLLRLHLANGDWSDRGGGTAASTSTGSGLGRGGTARGVVLRVGGEGDEAGLGTEVAALALAAEHGVPAPRLLAAEVVAGRPVVLVEQVPGSSAIPAERPPDRLRTLGRVAAALHAVALAPGPALPRRDRPIASVDFAALRRQGPPRPLLLEAEARVATPPAGTPEVFVHGDLWQGNALWDGDTLTGLIDWDCAGAGAPGVDLGSLRCDAAVCFGPGAAGDVLAGWEEAAGRPAADVAHWDVVAALSTPPDMGWFPGAIAGQGRPDLTRELLLRRRDAFLRAALDRLDAGG